MEQPDFGGYATRNDLVCSDGLIIRKDAFKKSYGKTVPLVWQHLRDDPQNIVGHAILSERPDGVYAEGYFNNTARGLDAKEEVRHGDINALSIHGIRLLKRGSNVVDGEINEVSLVLRGANPGASIDHIYLNHSEDSDNSLDEGIIYTGLTFDHSYSDSESEETEEPKDEHEVVHSNTIESDPVDINEKNVTDSDKGDGMAEDITVQEKYDSLDDDTKLLIDYLVGLALESKDDNNGGEAQHSDGGYSVNYNIFESSNDQAEEGASLSHSDLEAIFSDARKGGSLKDSVLQHAQEYGINDIDVLFPDAKAIRDTPDFVSRRMEWVQSLLNGVNQSPFAKVKSMSADLTLDSARAKGYVKGQMKKEEYFALQKRETSPATVYKKQKLDRDDIIDIVDFDVVVWLKSEMRMMLDEEIARAILIGDGREIDDEERIADPSSASSGRGIRSIYHDSPFYAHSVDLATNVSGVTLVEEIIRSMINYKGTGTPNFYTSRRQLTDLLLLKDKLGRRLYSTKEELLGVLQVADIIPVEVFDEVPELIGIVVNPRDYTIGSTAGGQLSFFDDFDIDYNQQKYLMETRLSGALTLPKSAVVIKRASGTQVTPTAPTFDSATNTITVPAVTGVQYFVDEVSASGTVTITEDAIVTAVPATGYYFPSGITTEWVFEHVAP